MFHTRWAAPPGLSQSEEARRRAGFNAELAAFKASTEAGRAYVQLAAPFEARAVGGWHSAYLTRQIWRVF